MRLHQAHGLIPKLRGKFYDVFRGFFTGLLIENIHIHKSIVRHAVGINHVLEDVRCLFNIVRASLRRLVPVSAADEIFGDFARVQLHDFVLHHFLGVKLSLRRIDESDTARTIGRWNYRHFADSRSGQPRDQYMS